MSTYFNYVTCLNPKQIDKTNKTLLDLRAKCVRDRVKLQETHSEKGQVSNTRRKYVIGLNGRLFLNSAGLQNVVQKTSCTKTRDERRASRNC